ncbi:MAG: aldo/keto reductase, partial [Pseudomonadota bacterium]
PKAETQGRTEEIIGSWFAARKNRDKVFLATKAVGRSGMTWFRDNASPTRIDRANLREALEKSLKRLRTDVIDLYQLHWPDRPRQDAGPPGWMKPAEDVVPVAEQLSILDDFVKEGKIRFIGLSNETAWGVAQFLKAASLGHGPEVVSVQNAYNLVNRAYESGLAEFARYDQVGLLAYSPLAQGYLSGKYEGGALPAGSRKALFDRLQRYEGQNAPEAIGAYLALAKKYDLDPSQLAIRFCMDQPFMTSVLIGATTQDQLEVNLGAAEISLPDALHDEINAVQARYRDPCP